MLRRAVTLVALLGMCGSLSAKDTFYDIPLNDLELTRGALPADENIEWRVWWRWRNHLPYAVLDGGGEAYVQYPRTVRTRSGTGVSVPQRRIVIRTEKPRGVTGHIFVPSADGKRLIDVGFRVPAGKSEPEARRAFYEVKRDHYEELLSRNVPGAAWFRHQQRQADAALGKSTEVAQPRTVRTRRPRFGDVTDTYALFSGGRAMSENLQLDRVLRPTKGGEESVDIGSIRGISVRKIDWKPLVAGLHPDLDPLARKVPADQHAIFFPSFAAAVRVADEMSAQGALVLQLAEPRSVSALTFQRYQHQMGLKLTTVARMLGPSVAQSVAVTGSDPYFRTGTDVAVLFETADPQVLKELLMVQLRIAAATNPHARAIHGEVNGLTYDGFRTPDRSLCSYVCRADGVVVVTNSPYQLQRIGDVINAKGQALAALDEFVFFRNRYQRGEDGETAFLFLSDDAIRRWCGPRWRIATSRRMRNAAVVAELQAGQMDRLVKGNLKPGPLYTDLTVVGGNELTLRADGVHCDALGSLAFMTPIGEQELQRVTKAEADAYRRWRDRYQSNWRWAFDPIGLRVIVEDARLGADLTVMPLIWGSDYRDFVALSRGAEFAADDGDVHDALAHGILAVNRKSEFLKRQSNFARMLAGGIEIDPIGWLGNSVGFYVDDDPLWAQMKKADPDDLWSFWEEHGWSIPIALFADVDNGLKLTAFLAAVRGFVQQASPGMLNWESQMYRDQPYVRITPTQRAIGRTKQLEHAAVYYCASGESLVITLNKNVLMHAIDRQLERDSGKEKAANGTASSDAPRQWIGKSLALQVNREVLDVLASAGRRNYQTSMQTRAWGNLYILNEWRRRYPDRDPVKLHQQFWHEQLVCPGGGEYRWNEKYQTMESTVYGSPMAPQEGPVAPPVLQTLRRADFGLTFEEQGLRARVSLDR